MSGNDVHVVGNVVTDGIELRFTGSGQAVGNTRIATNRRWQKDGEWQEEASFFDVVIWGQMADNLADTVNKGDRIMVSGRLQQRTWEDQDGNPRSKVEIVADEVGPSLRWAKATIVKNPRQEGGGASPEDGGGSAQQGQQRSGGRPQQGQQRQQEPAGRTYGRGSAPSATSHQPAAASGGYNYGADEEPF